MKEIYFDNAATTKPFDEAVQRMLECLTVEYGNPSSLHRKGMRAENILKENRKALARALGVKPAEIIFTSGGTEANNTAIRGIARSYCNRGKHIISSKAEHPSVYRTLEQLQEEGFEISYINVDEYGTINLEELEDAIRKDTILVTLIAVNNETGTVQPIAEIGGLIHGKNPLTFFHADCIQAFMKVPVVLKGTGIHLISLSAHKFHGPKGIGAVYCREGINLKAWQTGGGQEFGLRSGTENLPGIAGMGRAAEIFKANFDEYTGRMALLKEHIRGGIKGRIDDIRFNTPEGKRSAPHILNVSIRGVKGEVLLHSLEGHGIYVSTGSACSSRQKKDDKVLQAIGLSNEEREGTIRISLCPFNTMEQADIFLDALAKEVKTLRELTGR